jgi:hypothetical protein
METRCVIYEVRYEHKFPLIILYSGFKICEEYYIQWHSSHRHVGGTYSLMNSFKLEDLTEQVVN